MLSCNKNINVLKTFKNLNIKFMQFFGLHYLANNKTCNFSFHMLIDQGVYYFYPTSIHYKPFLRLLVSGLAVQEKGLSSSIGFLKVVLVIACNQDCYDSAANRADKSSFSSAMATPREPDGQGESRHL